MDEANSSVLTGQRHSMPLVVDLDGTLLQSDLLIESAFANLGRNPLGIFSLLLALFHGKATLKSKIADTTDIDVSCLPYNTAVLTLIREARTLGRPVYLASASNERYVSAVAEHLNHFDGFFASSDTVNLSANAKADRLMEAFGENGFDYIGNDKADLPVWAAANHCTAMNASNAVRSKLKVIESEADFLENNISQPQSWIRLLRVHQWAKNALVFVPLLTAQRFDALSIVQAIGAFVLFSMAASSVYVLNDLVDLEADRKHPTKKRRPLAAGTVSVWSAMVVALVLLVAAPLGALAIAPWFAVTLLGYLGLTMAYTFVLKRKMILDVIALALLYTIRVIGGAAAVSVPVSEWLLAFSMFIFTALALIKRYVELATRLDADLPDPSNRNYRKSDLDIVAALAAAAGFNGVTVFALYISSDTVHHLYRHPAMLWLICPVLMYWLGRALMMAHRRILDDDPILFALRDWNSRWAAVLVGAILVVAML
jgi:4-hydroxybenzoate polyprenyltransferase